MIRELSSNASVNAAADGDGPVGRLLQLCAGAGLFRATDGRYYAAVGGTGGRPEVYALRSDAFRDWLIDGYGRQFGEVPSDWAIRRARSALGATARFSLERPTVFDRVGQYDGRYYLDLADRTGRAVEITAEGWRVIDRPPIRFCRPDGQLPLPEPSHDGSIDLLWPYLNVSEGGFWTAVIWEIAALRPTGPYPILELTGPAGVGKSTCTWVLRHIIDPTMPALLSDPRNIREVMVATRQAWIQAYNNISVMPVWFSDALCILASGGAVIERASLATDECRFIQAQRPTIINGIDELLVRLDAGDRKISVEVGHGWGKPHGCEQEMARSLERDHPSILGGLLNIFSGALRELPNVPRVSLPRMADFAVFAEATGRALGWPPGRALSNYHDFRREVADARLDESPAGCIVVEFARQMVDWSGTPANLFGELTAMADQARAGSSRWPKSPLLLSKELRRISGLLGMHGVSVAFRRSNAQRLISISAHRRPAEVPVADITSYGVSECAGEPSGT
jgi:hypothetical protein